MRLARFPWPRKDDTHRSVTAFFSRFPWPRKDDTHRSVTGFLRVVDANRFARQAACSVYAEGVLWFGVKPAIAQLVEHLTVELAEIGWSGRICLTPYVDQKLADVLQCSQH